MIQVADNFNYRGKKPNFDRDSFDTLYDMKNYSENSLDNGHISYRKETDKHYKFNSNNQSDPTTGKWVEQHEAVPADEEDITEQNGTLQLANKTYDKQSFSGLGRVYLRKNIVGDKNVLTQAMINKANTIYVIQYDYDLNGQTIVTPSNSILKFDGGSFDNGIVDISNTTDLINPKFNKNCKIAKDTILKDFVDVRTLGIYPDDTDYGWSKLDNLCNKANTVYFFPRGIYKFTSGIKLYQSGTTLIGECTYADIMTVNDESLRGTVFDFSISSGTSEKPKYCINFADSYSSNISFIARGILLDQNFSGVNNKFNINREDINLVSSIRNNTLVKDIVKYIDYKDIPTLNMVANLGGVSIEYIKGKPVISGDMYVSKMGTTQERPANIINKGFQYFDTTINKPIFWDGSKWIDATGATV